MGSFPLRGLDSHSWDKRHEEDLVVVKSHGEPDAVSRWFIEKVVPAYHHAVGKLYKVQLYPASNA